MSNTAKVDAYIAEQMNKLQDNPQCANTHYNLGMGFLTKRMFKEAEESFLKAVDCSSKLVEAYVQLGGIAMQRGDLEGCLHYNEIAAKNMPLFPVPYANMGFVHMQRGNVDEAIKAFKQAIKKDANFVQAIASLGGALYMKGDLDESEGYSKRALEIEANFGPALNNLALVELERGNHAKAREYVEQARKTGFEPPEGLLKELEAHGA
ncbi:tetratricopeptide repeat protein [Desulfocurvibacter africanus]|uniref:Tetratricopeptide TPR_1 repeat-containing protein n=1 Tax=Desulfocurvibacter africanus subsp. africanus str. Walvis Bay TaxID=690850 RepID=F3YZK8_DESAF|nr:tetratricopeptide repeat protein [Desulfocurvibacter africanus]EGJ49707.1 Tetratricopeptide TPR_1 repeat-containing protein [Desulfocurvibacter africanus subsp. africanus str. Walvis Bay]